MAALTQIFHHLNNGCPPFLYKIVTELLDKIVGANRKDRSVVASAEVSLPVGKLDWIQLYVHILVGKTVISQYSESGSVLRGKGRFQDQLT